MHYIRFGQGARYLVALHGFADRGELFLRLREGLEAQYTVIAVDLPFHGQTDWPSAEFYPAQLCDALQEILTKEGIHQFSFIGHSMGGRLAVALSEYFAEQLEDIILLAPAGFQGTISDQPILFPKWLRKFLKYLTSAPRLVLGIMYFFHRLGAMNKANYRFLEQQMGIEDRRKRLFDCWISLYNFPIRLKAFKQRIQKHKIRLFFFYGKTDGITPAKYGQRFIADLPDARLTLVPDGHFFLREPLSKALKENLVAPEI